MRNNLKPVLVSDVKTATSSVKRLKETWKRLSAHRTQQRVKTCILPLSACRTCQFKCRLK